MIKSGTVVTCPSCKKPQIKNLSDILPGGRLGDSDWESLGYSMDDGGEAKCWDCGSYFYSTNVETGVPEIHTENGWVPLSKKLIQLLDVH